MHSTPLAAAANRYVAAFVMSILVAVGVAPGVDAMQVDSSGIPRARTLMQQGDFAGAAVVLERVTQADSTNATAWALLGSARRQGGDPNAAVEAYRRAASFSQTGPAAMYALGSIYAGMGQVDDAFQWLREAKATGQIDVTPIGIDPSAEVLRRDPRYATLFPTEDEFADPFVEGGRIIHEWTGEALGDQFGWIARNAGDLDGDGINDVVTSAPTNGQGGTGAGKVYAYSGRTGAPLWTAVGDSGAGLGTGIEAAGDVNGDGVQDVIAGAPGANRAFVYSGRDGTLLKMLSGENPGDTFGADVMDMGDVDRDGHADVMVGAPGHSGAGENAGKAYVFSGRDWRVLWTASGERAGDAFGSASGGRSDGDRAIFAVGAPNAGPGNGGRTYVYVDLSPTPSFVIEADSTGGNLGGMFISIVGDINADGAPDVYASDWNNRAKGAGTGRIYVHSGVDGARLLTLTGETAGDGFGIGPADAGDVDGDGHDDLVIGAWRYSGAAPVGGKVYLYSGRDGSILRTYTGKVSGETLGFDATGIGDVDGDGTIDLLLTSAWSSINGTRSGRVFIVSGR